MSPLGRSSSGPTLSSQQRRSDFRSDSPVRSPFCIRAYPKPRSEALNRSLSSKKIRSYRGKHSARQRTCSLLRALMDGTARNTRLFRLPASVLLHRPNRGPIPPARYSTETNRRRHLNYTSGTFLYQLRYSKE